MNTPQEFAELLGGLRALDAGERAALVTLTRTRGSTFRRAGARMLVRADGRRVRSLSGGCPERDIALHAQSVIADGQPRIVRYNRQQNFDVMVEMGCGGELEVLIEPLYTTADWRFAEAVADCLARRETAALATVYARDGAALRPQRLLLGASAACAEVEDIVLAAMLREHLASLGPHERALSLSLLCGGHRYDVQLEAVQPPCAAHLFGDNATSRKLAALLAGLGWGVTLVAPRPEADDVTAAASTPLALAPEALAQSALSFDARSFAVVMTHQLELDIAYLAALLDRPLAYVGAIGARQRVARLRTALGASAVRLHAPAGLDIGAETPEEIALAIAAEMLAVANGHRGGALSAHDEPIHH